MKSKSYQLAHPGVDIVFDNMVIVEEANSKSDKIEILTSDTFEDAKVLAKMALDGMLYIQGWTLRFVYQQILAGHEIYANGISMVLKNDKPIAITIVNGNHVCQSYTVNNERLRGYGSKTIAELKEKFPELKGNCGGEYGTPNFFKKSGCVDVIEYYDPLGIWY